MDIRAYDKLMAITPEERESLFNTKMMIGHEEKVKRKFGISSLAIGNDNLDPYGLLDVHYH